MVNTKNFFYSDDSHSGLVKVDGNMIYIPFEYAQLMCGMKDPVPRASALHVRFVNTEALEQNCAAVRTLWNNFVEQKKDAPYANLLNNVRVETWIVNRQATSPHGKEQTMLSSLPHAGPHHRLCHLRRLLHDRQPQSRYRHPPQHWRLVHGRRAGLRLQHLPGIVGAAIGGAPAVFSFTSTISKTGSRQV